MTPLEHLGSFLWTINPFVWAFGNIVLAYTFFIVLAIFVFYSAFMSWKKYAVGRLLRRLYAALALLSGTSVYRVFFGAVSWWEMPDGVSAWRPVMQTAIYVFIAVTMTQILLVMVNRWRYGSPLQIGVDPKPRERTGSIVVGQPGD